MNIQILDSWLREFLDTNAKPKDIARCLALCGPSVESVIKTDVFQSLNASHEVNLQSSKTKQKDWLYDIEVTTNRVDMMSVMGIAREAAAILPQFGYTAKLLPLSEKKRSIASLSKDQLQLTIQTDPKLTSRVMAVVLEIQEVLASPQWLQARLETAGIRSLNTIVDITNYVMLEIGHPTHVFDYDRIEAARKDKSRPVPTLAFRLSKKKEKIITLDKKTYELPGNDIVIENGQREIIDLPGIMGTYNSVVTQDTKRIVFFIDNNNPKLMRATSMATGIRTNAVTLNEKNVDPELATVAMARGIELYQHLSSAKVVSQIYDIYDHPPVKNLVSLTHSFITARLGVDVKTSFVKKTLNTLGFEVTEMTPMGTESEMGPEYTVAVPSWRCHDVTIAEDIVEEIARIYGYHNLPSVVSLQTPSTPFANAHQFSWEYQTKQALKYWGFVETYTYSLVSVETQHLTSLPQDLSNSKLLQLKNPLSQDWLYLRQSIIPSLLPVLHTNQSQSDKLALFELANVYLPQNGELPQERQTLAMAVNKMGFFDLKGILEALALDWGVMLKVTPTTAITLCDKQIQATIAVNDKIIGWMGKLNHALQQQFELVGEVLLAELDFSLLTTQATTNKTYTPLSKYPSIVEHLTFFNDKQVTAAKILSAPILGNGYTLPVGRQVPSLRIIGAYQNKLTLEVTYQDLTQNLTDEMIAPIRKKLVSKIEDLGLKLQGEI